ncbi:MAG: hypothetical protein H0W08_08745 [Acidobacteria bacterium]|nr:hypothetical protein [Acidobacteriota bacterium]
MRISRFTAAFTLLAAVAQAQDVPAIKIDIATVSPKAPVVMVVFSEQLTATSTAAHFDRMRVRLMPTNVTPTGISQNIASAASLTVVFTAIPAGTTRICFDSVQFTKSGVISESSGQVCADLSDFEAEKQARLKAFGEAAKAAGGKYDKDIFASGFVTTASEESAGGADLSLTPDLNIPGLESFVRIKKATADEGDARHFEAGAEFSFAGTWKPSEMRRMAETPPGEELNKLLRARQSNIIAGWLVDVGVKLEGDPTNFNVTNFVMDSGFQLRTMTKGFLGRRGFWRGFILPVGVEAGQSLGAGAVEAATVPAAPAAPAVNKIVRYKGGAGLTIYFDNPNTQIPLRRIALEANTVLRQLFRDESRINDETKLIDTTDKGTHAYTEVDLKVFVAETAKTRYGLKISFNRGRLPPVYAEVKSFDFGFLMETDK